MGSGISNMLLFVTPTLGHVTRRMRIAPKALHNGEARGRMAR